jgi:hypothetical protein
MTGEVQVIPQGAGARLTFAHESAPAVPAANNPAITIAAPTMKLRFMVPP